MLYYLSDIFATCLGYIKILNHVAASIHGGMATKEMLSL